MKWRHRTKIIKKMNEILKYFVMSYFYHLDILNLNLINKFEYLDKKKFYEKNVNAKFLKE